MQRMQRIATSCLLASALVACDARPSSTLRALGVATPPTWMGEDCEPESRRTILSIPAERYWRCRLPALQATTRVDWWRGIAVAGERTWDLRDATGWERLQEEIATTLGPLATRRTCARPPRGAISAWHVQPRVEVWVFTGERRWAVTRAAWFEHGHGGPSGSVWVETGPGDIEPCADSLYSGIIVVD